MRPPWFFQPFSTGMEGLVMIPSLASVTTSMWARAPSIPDNSSSVLASLFPWSSSSSATSPSGEQPSNLHPFSNLIRSSRTQELIRIFIFFVFRILETRRRIASREMKMTWTLFGMSFCYFVFVGPIFCCAILEIKGTVNLGCFILYWFQVCI